MFFSTFTRIIIITCSCIDLTNSAIGQIYKENTPLHKFFQKNCDSIIIYHSWSSWNPYPNYSIIAKQDKNIFFFRYRNPYKMIGNTAPKVLLEKFVHEHVRFINTKPDTNRYFVPVYVKTNNKDSLWEQITSFDIWNLSEVKEEPGVCESYDDLEETYYLITKDSIKVLNYYALNFLETCKPKNINRQKAIKTREEFQKVFAD